MRGWLGLGGGDEFGHNCERGDRALLEMIGKQVRVAIVPTAQADGGSDPVRAGNNGVRYFERLGAFAENVMITDRESAADPQLIECLTRANLIYIIGGNPGYLLQTLRNTPALQAIIDAWNNGTALVGSSAGAMMLCAAQLGPPSGVTQLWIAGIGLVPGVLAAVHHEHSPDGWGIDLLKRLPPDYSVIGIDACNLAVWQPDGKWRMFGGDSVRVYTSGENAPRRYRHGETWTLPHP
jgi:cyanophycinase-like exopeptidase